MTEIQEHFDEIASQYDQWKARNWYYYGHLKRLLRELIPPDRSVLEVGCATGDLLRSLEPNYGLGIDLSPVMIARAELKHQEADHLEFIVSTAEQLTSAHEFDYIFMVDVIEHLTDVPATMVALRRLSARHTKLVITMANPLWEPLLLLLERLKLKMPEGPHKRWSEGRVRAMIIQAGFDMREEGHRLLLPLPLPYVSDWLNRLFWKWPLIKHFGLITYYIATPTESRL